MHINGDLLSYGYATGWKLRDPGLAAAVLTATGSGEEAGVDYADVTYDHELFDHATHVLSDAGRARCVVWGRLWYT